jgi:uncharacterized membrane protein YciS (DUF1049 family)
MTKFPSFASSVTLCGQNVHNVPLATLAATAQFALSAPVALLETIALAVAKVIAIMARLEMDLARATKVSKDRFVSAPTQFATTTAVRQTRPVPHASVIATTQVPPVLTVLLIYTVQLAALFATLLTPAMEMVHATLTGHQCALAILVTLEKTVTCVPRTISATLLVRSVPRAPVTTMVSATVPMVHVSARQDS